MQYLKTTITAISIAAVLTACGEKSPSESKIASAETTTASILVQDAYIIPPFPGRDVAAGFFTLNNPGGEDRLVSVASSDSQSAEIHTHTEEDGIMRMRRIEGLDLPAGAQVNFEPGGYHIMFFGVNFAKGQKTVEVTFEYESSAPQTLTLPIEQHDGPSADRSDSGAESSGTHGSGTQDSGTKGSDSHGSGTKDSGTHGSGTQDSGTHGSGTDHKQPKSEYGSAHEGGSEK